jgi:hypothetical protein
MAKLPPNLGAAGIAHGVMIENPPADGEQLTLT